MTQWRDYAAESDQLAYDAKRHANATREYHRQLVELQDRAVKTPDDWTRISSLIVIVQAGWSAADTYAQLAHRAAVMADLKERTDR